MDVAGSYAMRRARNLPWPAIGLGLGLFALLAAFVSADPASNATFSSSPFTDEGFNVVNARNLVQIGRWNTDQWNLYLVNLPYSFLAAAAFRLLGVGIDSARLMSIGCVSVAAASLGAALASASAALAVAGPVATAAGIVVFIGVAGHEWVSRVR